uniref:Uncharacterized protein n=1 Tax=Marseillevirus LCMAC103 TaxID=2506604 RepID=A0A481YVJ1_9VIRU|nr:MAG: uncharacterized protein LCMAC103_01480 [Marseillevirus LCMAC103]
MPKFALDLAKATVYTRPRRATKTPETKEDEAARGKVHEKGVALFTALCTGAERTPEEKYQAATALLRAVPDVGIDVVKQWLDSLPFRNGDDLGAVLDLLDRMLECPTLSSHDKITIAVSLYNGSFIGRCYAGFAKILRDTSMKIDHRVEACRHLFSSGLSDHKSTALSFLLEATGAASFPSRWRYQIIAGFVARTGLGTLLNREALQVAYDEEFVHTLQAAFFSAPHNGIRERILAGQHLLGMECVSGGERGKVEKTLLAVAGDDARSDNERADAADVVIRGGSPDAQTAAQAIVTQLGFAAVPNRARTVYTNKQNIHAEAIGEAAAIFISNIPRDKEYLARAKNYVDVHTEISALVRAADLSKDDRFKCYESLNRINIDTAQYTAAKLTAADVLAYVWHKVQGHAARDAIENRLLEELVTMSDTCGTGHEIRPVNALSGFDGYINVLKISFEDQIVANVVGRVNARIQNIGDAAMLDSVVMAPLPEATDADRSAYRAFIADALDIVRGEMHAEFVGEGHVALDEFAQFFADGAARFELA